MRQEARNSDQRRTMQSSRSYPSACHRRQTEIQNFALEPLFDNDAGQVCKAQAYIALDGMVKELNPMHLGYFAGCASVG